jgi:hypothetical protein
MSRDFQFFAFWLHPPSFLPVETTVTPKRPRKLAISSEAMIGIGITVGSFGLLGLLLGWAQQMRGISTWAAVWLAIGAVLAIVGILIAAVAGVRRRRS